MSMTVPVNSIADLFTMPAACRERVLAPSLPGAEGIGDLGLLGAGLSDLRLGYAVGSRARAYGVMVFTLSGAGRLVLPRATHVLRAGAGAWLPAGSAHEYRARGPWRILWLHLHPEWTPQFHDGGSREAVVHGCDVPRLWSLVEGAIAETLSVPARDSLAIDHARLALVLAERALGLRGRPGALALRPLLEAVDADLRRPWRLADLARLLHVSVPTLRRLVQRECGCAPMALVRRLRLRRADALLRTTDEPVHAIAARVGYEDPFAFSRAFARAHGASPSSRRLRPPAARAT